MSVVRLFGWLLAATLLLSVVGVRSAHAHDPFESTSVVTVHPGRIQVRTILAPKTAEELFGKGHLPTLSEPGAGPSVRTPALDAMYELTSSGNPLALQRTAVARGTEGEAEGDLVLDFEFQAPTGAEVVLRARYLERLEQGYTGVVQVVGGKTSDLLDIKVLHSADPWLTLAPPRTAPRSAEPSSVQAASQQSSSAQPTSAAATQPSTLAAEQRPNALVTFLGVGLEHVVLGYDHLLFLASVLLACARLGQVVRVLTTFTLAHSVTLSLAALGLVPLLGSIVEPLIALSILVAAFWGARLEARKLLFPVTFAFGLVHGLGFAAGLASLADAGSVRVVGLVGFNLGVELGQILVALALWPLIGWCRGSERGSAALLWTMRAIGATGGALFLLRVLYGA